MRKFLVTYLPASMLLAIMAMVLFTCGGGGGGGSSTPAATLTGLSISGPSSMNESVTATYKATASWDDNTTSTVTPTWSVNSQMASISIGGVLSCPPIDSDQTVTVTATYSSGGITETATMDVTITNTTPVAWQPGMLLGSAQFEENIGAGDVYSSYLYIFNADSSFRRYGYENPPDTSIYETGTWSINASGQLILTIPGQGPITVTLLFMPFMYAPVLVDEGTGTPYNTKWDWAGPGPYPFDASLIPGTYVNQFGDTWIFNADGTGSTTGDGGWTYTWSVVGGILKVVFPNEYVGSMYELPGSQTSATSYTIIEWAFVIHTPTGEFGSYYGGMELTRQGGEPPPGATLTGLSINGPSSMAENSTATYTATAVWSDSSTSSVTPTWSVNPQVAEISPGGVLSCQAIDSDQMVTVTATYSSGGITETATMNVTITNITTTLSVVITGTVPGTVAIAYDLATGKEAARDVADGTPKTFTLNVAPGTYYLMFLANEGTSTQGSYPFYNITGGNVFTFEANTTLDLGILVYNNYPHTATPLIDPISGNENVTETFMSEASFSPGDGKWTATRTFVNSTCSGHSPGTTVTENVTIAHGWGLVTYTPAGTNETAVGFANVNTAILTASSSALETIILTMQPDGSLAGTYSKVGYGGECSEDATITAVLK